ncbi:ALF repeat-containing protein [Kitasatospora sp. NPDC052896]|uniref:ALF repeat-containing protein n=1 Tax=Kitasatospora sp. NPDC052896 TaxID=3364061 RepID=UPI0037C9149C
MATAKKVFEVARQSEAEDLNPRTAGAIERANTARAQTDRLTAAAAADLGQARGLDTTAASLAAEADRPGADVKAVAVKGRQLAIAAMKDRSPFAQQAAARALSGTDLDVLDYLRTGWGEAERRDVRQQVFDLTTQSPYEAVRTGAANALKGSDQQVADFAGAGQYQAALSDLQVKVSQVNNTGGPGVKEASRAALASNDPKAMAAFLVSGQYGALVDDDRVTASKLVNTGGPEVQAAAKVALAGPADELHEFVQVGQYMADRKDQLTATHTAQMQRLIADTSGVAATARQKSWTAAKSTADANKAADEANRAARRG